MLCSSSWTLLLQRELISLQHFVLPFCQRENHGQEHPPIKQPEGVYRHCVIMHRYQLINLHHLIVALSWTEQTAITADCFNNCTERSFCIKSCFIYFFFKVEHKNTFLHAHVPYLHEFPCHFWDLIRAQTAVGQCPACPWLELPTAQGNVENPQHWPGLQGCLGISASPFLLALTP